MGPCWVLCAGLLAPSLDTGDLGCCGTRCSRRAPLCRTVGDGHGPPVQLRWLHHVPQLHRLTLFHPKPTHRSCLLAWFSTWFLSGKWFLPSCVSFSPPLCRGSIGAWIACISMPWGSRRRFLKTQHTDGTARALVGCWGWRKPTGHVMASN